MIPLRRKGWHHPAKGNFHHLAGKKAGHLFPPRRFTDGALDGLPKFLYERCMRRKETLEALEDCLDRLKAAVGALEGAGFSDTNIESALLTIVIQRAGKGPRAATKLEDAASFLSDWAERKRRSYRQSKKKPPQE
jgi:hypothetical protein